MKVSMESKYKAVSVIWAIFGALFFAGAGVMFIMRGDMPQMPRADIAYVGFLVVGAIFGISAVATYCMAGDKNAMIEENDERAKMISGMAGNPAFVIQTVLLCSALFLLCFMGYANAAVMITFMCLIAVSVFVYFILVWYYSKKM